MPFITLFANDTGMSLLKGELRFFEARPLAANDLSNRAMADGDAS